MAEQGADGSIVLDTGLDTKGFDRGSKELLAAINALTKEIEHLGQTLQTTFSAYGNAAQGSDGKMQQLEQTTAQLEAQVESLNAKVAELEAQLAEAGQQTPVDGSAFDAAGDSADNARDRVAQLEAQIANMESYIAQLQGQLEGAGGVVITPELNTAAMQSETMGLDEALKTLETDLADLGGLAEQAFAGDDQAVRDFRDGAAAARNKIAEMERALQRFGATRIPTDDYTWLQTEVDKCSGRISDLMDRQQRMEDTGVRKSSRAWKNLQYEIDQTRYQMETYKAEMSDMEQSGEAFTMGSDTAAFSEYYSQLMQAKQALADMESEVQATGGRIKANWSQMTTLTGGLKNAFQSAGTAISTGIGYAAQAVMHPLQSLDRLLGSVVSAAGRTAGKLGSMVGGAAIKGVQSLANGAKRAAQQLTAMVSNAVKTGLSKLGSLAKRAASSVFSLGNSGKKADVSLKKGLKTVLKYAFGIRSLYILVNKLKAAIKEGFGSLAQYSPEINSAVSSMSGALSTLKLSLSTAFAPIVTAVAPAITYLINLLTTAVNTIGMFFAAVTGQKSFVKAKQQVTDYAASQDKTAKSTSAATDAAKEEKRQLASFDDLEILSEDKSSGGSGGGSGGGTDPSSMFETVSVDSGITGFVQQIKDLFAAGDYDEIGHIIAQQINKAFEMVKGLIAWDRVGGVVTKYVNAFCGIFNGLVKGINWTMIGNTFGEGINTILHTVNLLANGIDWVALGAAISTGLNGLVDSIDWDLFGDTLGSYFSAKLNLLTSAVLTFNWGSLGSSLATGVNSLVDNLTETVDSIDWDGIGSGLINGLNGLVLDIDWDDLGALLGKSFNAVLDVIHSAASGFSWSEAGEKMGSGVNTFASSIDWATLGQTLSDAIKGAFQFLSSAIKEIDWWQLGEDVKTFLVNIDWAGIFEAVCDTIGAAFGGLAAFLGGLIGDAVEDAKEYFSEKIEECGGNIVAGIFKGIVDAIAGIGTWIVEHIFEPFIQGFKDAFGIHSPSTVMSEQGGFLIDGLLEGITATWENLTGWISDALSDLGGLIGDAWDGIKSTASSVWEGITGTVGDAWDGLKGTASTVWDGIKGTIGDAWDSITGKTDKSTDDVKSNVEDAWGNVDKSTSSTWKTTGSSVSGSWKGMSTVTASVSGAVKKSVSSAWDAIKSTTGITWDTSKSKVQSAWNDMKSTTASASDSVKKTTGTAYSNVKSQINTQMDGAKSAASNAWSAMSSNASTMSGNIRTSVGNSYTGVKTQISTQMDGAKTAANNAWNTMKTTTGTANANIKSNVDQSWNAMKTSVRSATAGISGENSAAWQNISSTVSGSCGTARNAVDRGYADVRNVLVNHMSDARSTLRNMDWGSIGTAICTGISNGINNSWPWLRDQVNNVARNLLKTAKSTLGIHSPSRVFRDEVGKNVGLGLAEGLNRSESAVTQAAEHMTDAVQDAFDISADVRVSGLSGLNDVLTDFAATVKDGFAVLCSDLRDMADDVAINAVTPRVAVWEAAPEDSALISTLQTLADRVAYAVPAMAAGTVVPYAARTESDPMAGVKSAFDASNDELISVVIQSVTNATSAIVGAIREYSGTEVNLDSRSMSTAIINEINRRTRAYGQSPLIGI